MKRWRCSNCSQKNFEDRHRCRRCSSPNHSMEESSSSSSSSSSSCNNGFNFNNEMMMGSTLPNATVAQNFDQVMLVEQTSDELIWIKDSCNITVDTNDTQAAISLQVGLQLAIALVISISLGDSIEGRAVAQELFQKLDSEQTNKQKVYIENSKDVSITTSDTDLSVNIQALLQVLVSLVVKLDVL